MEVNVDSPNEEKKEETQCLKQRLKFIRYISILTGVLTVVCIYYFSNVSLNKIRDECRDSQTNISVMVKLIVKGDWYVFIYENQEWSVPRDSFYTGMKNNTSIPVFISADKQHINRHQEDYDCNDGVILFNFLYTFLAMPFTLLIPVVFCSTSCKFMCCLRNADVWK